MNTTSEETPEVGNQRRKLIGSGGSGGKTRRYSVGVPSSRKSIGEEGNVVPNYLRASTGSCHDFCKFGKKHEHSKSSVPIKFKTTSVSRDKFTKTVVALDKKKMTLTPSINHEILTPGEPDKVTKKVALLPSKKPQVLKQSSSANGKTTKNGLKTVQRSTSFVKTSPVVVNLDASSEVSNGGIKKIDIPVKKTGVTPKTGPVKNVAPKASFSGAASLNTSKHRGIKPVSPLKDQNRIQKTEPKKRTDDKVQTKTLHGVEAEPEVKPETMEFDFTQSSMESVNDPVCNSSESFSGKNVVEEESLITRPVYESSESFPEKEVLEEESLIAPPASESSESFYDDEVVEEESEYTDDEVVEVEVEGEGSEGSETADVNEMETADGNHKKIPRKGRMVISEDKDEKAVKLRFRRGKILDVQSENNGPRRLKFRRRVAEGSEDGQSNNGSRKLKFTRGKIMEGNEDRQHVSKRSYEKKYVEEKQDSNNRTESVVLKHQGEQGKKDAQGLFNNVIEETASKLVESRKSKVKALVGAFETVISLQDSKPTST